MRAEAEEILKLFRRRELRAGDHIDSGDVMEETFAQAGSPEHEENLRLAWQELVEDGYLIEYLAALELTDKGEQYLYGRTEQTWTHQDLQRELRNFEADLRAAGLRDSSVKTYVDRSERFVRWLIGDYEPRGPVE